MGMKLLLLERTLVPSFNNQLDDKDMKSFKQHIVEFDNPQIYCDMDGVVGDFLKFTRNILGQSLETDFGKIFQKIH